MHFLSQVKSNFFMRGIILFVLLVFLSNCGGGGDKNPMICSMEYCGPSDTTPPTLSISSPQNNSTVCKSPLLITGTASDSGSGIKEVKCGNTTASGKESWSCSVTLSAGSNSIKVIAYDKAGNKKESTLTITYKADSANPTLTITFPPTTPYSTTENTITITGTATDTGETCGLDKITCTLSGNTITATGKENWSCSLNLSQGNNSITVKAYDHADKTESKEIVVIYDTVDNPPTLTITEPSSKSTDTNQSLIKIKGTATDDKALSELDCNGSKQNLSGLSTPWECPISLTSEGVKDINITVKDSKGQTKSETVKVNYDITQPDINVTKPSALPHTEHCFITYTIEGTASDPGTSPSGIAEVKCPSCLTQTDETPTSWSFNTTLNSGTNTFIIHASDKAGNPSSKTIPITLELDQTSPTVTITSPTNNEVFKTDKVEVKGTASDSECSISEIKYNGTTCTGTDNFTCSNVPLPIVGTNTITIKAKNTANKEGNASVNVKRICSELKNASIKISNNVDKISALRMKVTFPPSYATNVLRLASIERGELLNSMFECSLSPDEITNGEKWWKLIVCYLNCDEACRIENSVPANSNGELIKADFIVTGNLSDETEIEIYDVEFSNPVNPDGVLDNTTYTGKANYTVGEGDSCTLDIIVQPE